MTKLFCVSDVFLFVFFMCVQVKIRQAESRSIIQTRSKKLMVVLSELPHATHTLL